MCLYSAGDGASIDSDVNDVNSIPEWYQTGKDIPNLLSAAEQLDWMVSCFLIRVVLVWTKGTREGDAFWIAEADEVSFSLSISLSSWLN